MAVMLNINFLTYIHTSKGFREHEQNNYLLKADNYPQEL